MAAIARPLRVRKIRADGSVKLSPVERMLLDLKDGDQVDVEVGEGGRIVIRKAPDASDGNMQS